MMINNYESFNIDQTDFSYLTFWLHRRALLLVCSGHGRDAAGVGLGEREQVCRVDGMHHGSG
jgi:hypothetical protein